ncbi:transthyretin-like family protein [Pseudoalteromonas sp. S2721]|uniref:transthyretin-like family protein n=1 Tax=Pseudoalteromonas sp. S2721 TaxID=579526 RepID=UPI0020177D08|nr:transthyretin-like family protein [Pseudoalteromonas sp. S2721]
MLGLIKYKVQLCPEVKGQLMYEGVPLKNQLIQRGLTLEEEEIDEAYTDEDGFFEFPEKTIKSRKPGSIFYETMIRVVIVTNYNNAQHTLWFGFQHGLKTPKVLKNKLNVLKADLSLEEVKHQILDNEAPSGEHNISSICRW